MAAAANRFVDTASYAGPRGLQYALLEVPAELRDLGPADMRRYVVTAADAGFPDRVMWAAYGIGWEAMWWAVALVNGVVDPDRDAPPGTTLLLPPAAALQSLSARANAAGGANG